jgi:hypothetical protein
MNQFEYAPDPEDPERFTVMDVPEYEVNCPDIQSPSLDVFDISMYMPGVNARPAWVVNVTGPELPIVMDVVEVPR